MSFVQKWKFVQCGFPPYPLVISEVLLETHKDDMQLVPTPRALLMTIRV
jgi:hypothetical protein